MEVQGFICGLCSNPIVAAIRSPQKQCLLTSHSSWTPKNSCLLWTHNYATSKTLQSFPLRVNAYFKRLECSNIAEVLSSDAFDEECLNKSELKRKKLVVFVSGGGSNFNSIHNACLQGSIHGDIVAVVTNKQGCGGAEYARSNGMSVLLFPRTKDDCGLSPTDLVTALRDMDVDFILLAGYLKLIPSELIAAYPKRILNIHPALLPAFGGKGYYGMKVHKAVIASGARFSGPTIHFVDESYDEGRILAQRVVPVLANDTPEELAARVLKEEHRLYVEAITALCEERIIWREDGVPLIQSRENPNKYK